MERRVVVTGIGAVTPLGLNIDDTWEQLKQGRHAVRPIDAFDTADYKAKLACQVQGFDPTQWIEKREARRMDRFTQLAFAAAEQAAQDSGLDFSGEDAAMCGVIIGSGIGGIETTLTEYAKLTERGPSRVSPLMIPMMIANMASGNLAIRFGLKGYSNCTVTACASSGHAVGDAFRLIKHGYQDVMLAGGAEAAVVPLACASFANMQALSEAADPDRASMPFDLERAGFVIGEGAGMLILEAYEHAVKRGARIYGEVAGYGATSDAHHITAPDPSGDGAARAMRLAISEGGCAPGDITYINAHGTSTPPNDRVETAAIHAAFGQHALKLMISSTKSMLGHTLGAAGAIEAIVTLLTMRDGFVHPTAGYLKPDPECDLDYVPREGRAATVTAALSNSFGFGGHNASLLLRAV